MTVYAFPRLSKTDLWFIRIGGDGLGNLLFNWARCLSDCQQHGWRMVWPTWSSFKPKNWRVNPYDHRRFANLFQPTADYLHGWRKPAVLLRHRWVSEAQAREHPPRSPCVVQYRGMAGKFLPFLQNLALVREKLLAMTRPEHLTGYHASQPAPIAIHVRRGDFVRQPDYRTMVSTHNSALPIEWYVGALEAARARAGHPVRARVFSDGTPEELQPLLDLPDVERVEYGSAIADMLALSRARLLIASGSTFSMWASYLHQVPTVWHPGKLLQHVHLEERGREVEWSPGMALPDWVPHLLEERAA